MVRRTVVLLALVVAAGCHPHRTPAPSDPGTLRVGTSGDYPPFSLRAADGAWSGFDVEVARAYASARGRRLTLVPFRWPDLARRLAAGDFDVAMSGVTVRADRLLTGTMTAAVARADAVVVVRRGLAPARGLDRPDVRIAVNRGGHLERVARAHLRRATLVTVDDNRRLPALLASGEVTAVVTDTLEAATFDRDTFTIAARLTRDRKAYWVGPGHEALAADLETWLVERERDGTLARLRAECLGVADEHPLPSDLARVVDAIARRLLLMPDVAAAKRAAGRPLVDPTREADVISRAVARGRDAGLDPVAVEHLARAQIGAARAVQESIPVATTTRLDAPTLALLRVRIDLLDAGIVRALGAARSAAPRVDRGALAVALRADADLVGFDAAHAGAIAAAIAEILLPAPG